MRLSPPLALVKLLIVMAPLVVCYGMPASWIGASHAIWGRDPLTDSSLSFLPTGHLCLLVFTLLCLVSRVIGIGF